MKPLYFLGVDIGKKTFHAAITMDGENYYDLQVDNTSTAIKKYFRELKLKFGLTIEQLIVCMEHTGIYCYPLLDYLTQENIKVYVEPALRIKQSQGMQRGKDDKVDSKRIARYIFKNHDALKSWKPKREVVQKLRALLVVRDRLVRAKNQFEVPINESGEFIEKSIRTLAIQNCKTTIAAINKDIKKVEAEISKIIKQDTQLHTQIKLATSVVGIGPIIAANMVVTTNEFKDITNHKKFACYSGVAPFPNSSGTSLRGKNKVSHLANKKMKTLLHLGARSAVQSSPELKAYLERKQAEGKEYFSIINAVCNKLISRVFVCVKNNRLYEKNYKNALA
jgi:transposase